MKTTIGIAVIILLFFFSFQACKDELQDSKHSLPLVETSSISEVDYSTATAKGMATSDGGAPIISRGVCWNTKGTPTLSDSKTMAGSGTGIFESKLTGLEPSTKYYVRTYATNSLGTVYGNEVTFTTGLLVLPAFATTIISSSTHYLTVVRSAIISDNGATISARGVCWNLNGTPTVSDNKTVDGSGAGVFMSNITGLIPDTTYFVRSYATNGAGTAYGEVVTLKTQPVLSPSLSKIDIVSLSQNSAVLSNQVLSENGATITARGVCWNVTGMPTIADNKSMDGSGTGTFTSTLSGLKPTTIYYVRSYATNSAGTAYGEEIMIRLSLPGDIFFNPNLNYGTLSDIDGNTYKTIQIGTQVWMAENLKTTKFNNGTAIPHVKDNASWDNLNTPGYCWYNNDEATCKKVYGALYNWFTVQTGMLCPSGWHVPSVDEWKILQFFLGGEDSAGSKLKETSITHWQSPNTGANNLSGFTAVPSGVRYYGSDYGFSDSQRSSHMFSSDYLPVDNYLDVLVTYNSPYFEIEWEDIHTGCSVRCLKN